MFYYFIVAVVLRILLNTSIIEANSNFEFVTNILQLKDGNIFLIADFAEQIQSDFLAEMMAIRMKPITIVNAWKINPGNSSIVARNCTEQSKRLSRLPSPFVVWVGSDLLSRVLLMFARTVSKCPRYIETGNYYRDNAFIFFIEKEIDSAKYLVFIDPLVKRHKNVAIAYKKRNKFIIYNYSVYDNSTSSTRMWEKGKPFKSVTDIYPNSSMNGFKFIVGTLTRGSRLVGERNPHPKSPTNKLINFAGYEFLMLQTLGAKFNFSFEIQNPADVEYGRLGKNGVWTGLPGCIVEDKCDLVIGSNTLAGDRTRVLLASHPFDNDFYTFASPRPLKYLNLLTLSYPLTLEVWIGTIASLILVTLSLHFIIKVMEKWLTLELKTWTTIGNLAFNTFGTVVGQDVTRTRSFFLFQSTSMRLVLATWLISVFIIFAGYSGSLRTFLISPSYEKPIETYADILKSGLPIDYMEGHTEGVSRLGESEDPIIKELWRRKTVTGIGPNAPSNTARVGKVYERKSVALLWNSFMSAIAYSSYSTPTGESLVHQSKYTPLPVYPESWGFSHLNPWFDRFNIQIMLFIETGIIDKWRVVTLNEMKRNSTVRIDIPDESKQRKMIVNDYSGVFVILCCSYLLCIAVFVVEFI